MSIAGLLVPEVVEAAVVPVADGLKGKVPDLHVTLKPGLAPSVETANKVLASVVSEIGAIERPRQVSIVPDMPKTRSGKIMRRVIASVSNFMDVGDVTTLANPEVVETIRKMVQAEKARRGEIPKDLSKEMIEEIKRYGAVE